MTEEIEIILNRIEIAVKKAILYATLTNLITIVLLTWLINTGQIGMAVIVAFSFSFLTLVGSLGFISKEVEKLSECGDEE